MSIGIGIAISPSFGGNVAWWQPGSTLDMDFAGNRISGAPSLTGQLTCTRTATSGKATVQATDGTWAQVNDNEPRISTQGILHEESRTNAIRNNSMQGLSAPSTPPTNWAASALPSGITLTYSAAGTENGVEYLDLTFAGTAGSSSDVFIRFENSNVIAATVGQVWTHSFFVKNISGTMPTTYCRIRERDSGGGQLAVLSTTLTVAASTAALGQSRQSLTATTANASTAFVMPTIEFTFVNATAYNFTVRVGWPQCELGGFVTSPIRTTSAAVTRSAESITVNTPASYTGMSVGSAYVEAQLSDLSGSGTSTIAAVIQDGNNRHSVYVNKTNDTINFSTMTASVAQYFLASTNGISANTAYKMAVRWQANSAALRVPTALVSPANNTSNTQPSGSVATIHIGSFTSGTNSINGYVKRVALFATAQSDAALAAMVA